MQESRILANMMMQQRTSRGLRTLINRRNRLLYHRAQEHDAFDPGYTPRREHLEWNQRAEMFAFSKRLSENMSEELLGVVFTDKSYLEKERRKREELGILTPETSMESNQSLAEKGRNVTSPFVKQYLRLFLPKLPEEGILALHDFLMHTETLSDMSTALGTSDLILCDTEVPTEEYLSRCLLAFIGGLAQEQGDSHAHKFIIDFILTFLQDKHIFEIWDLEDSRQTLQTILSNEGLGSYEPRLIRETGKNSLEPCFAVGIFVNKEIIAWASAETVAEAEEMAAFEALKKFFEIKPGDFIFRFGKDAYELDYESYKKENMFVKAWTTIQGKKSPVNRLSG